MGLAGAGSGALPPPLICREMGALMLILRSKEGPANLVLADCGEKAQQKCPYLLAAAQHDTTQEHMLRQKSWKT